jgi:hypothetical protein
MGLYAIEGAASVGARARFQVQVQKLPFCQMPVPIRAPAGRPGWVRLGFKLLCRRAWGLWAAQHLALDRGVLVGLGPAARVGRLLADGRVPLAVAACQRAAPAHTPRRRTSVRVVSVLSSHEGSV